MSFSLRDEECHKHNAHCCDQSNAPLSEFRCHQSSVWVESYSEEAAMLLPNVRI